MERPTIKENIKGYSLEEVHKLYTDCPELYRHIVKLDEYIDYLEDKLNNLAIHDVVKSLPTEECVRYWWKEGDIDDNFWQHSTEWSNEDVFKEVYKALKYFINRWQ